MAEKAHGRRAALPGSVAPAKSSGRPRAAGRRATVQKSNLAYLIEATPKVPTQRAAAVAVAGVLVAGISAAAPAQQDQPRPADPVLASSTQAPEVASAPRGAEIKFEQVSAASTAKKDSAPSEADTKNSADKIQTLNDPEGAKAFAVGSLGGFGWGGDQMQCLTALWNRESGWRTTAENPSSLAYGIAQSLPAEKMASVGADYRTNYKTQITWGLGYIKGRYGSPCGAWGHSQATGWY